MIKTIILTLLMFGLIITLHELGHFMFAKLFGVRVNEFAFGMGPKIWSKKKGETRYSIRAFPIGGYVAMDGEDGETEETRILDGRAFCDKKAWQRFLILFAGAAMNIILGFVVLLFLSSQMKLMGTNVVARLEENAPAAQYIQPNDRIIKVNGHSTNSYNDVVFQLVRDEDGIIDIVVEREADPKSMSSQKDKGTIQELKNVPFTMVPGEDGRNLIQLDMTFYGVPNTFLGTIRYSANWTVSVVKQVWFSLLDILSGRYGLNEMAGPVGTATVVEQASSQGYQSLLMVLAFITINVGVFNLLPVPALDGGRLFFLLIEIIFRKPVPQKYESYIHAAGMIILLGFIAVVTFNDVLKLIQL